MYDACLSSISTSPRFCPLYPAVMSASQSPGYIPSEEDDPRTIVYDPSDPFWHDTEDDNDDMEYVPAPGDSEDNEDDEDELDFHGMRCWHVGMCVR